MLDTQATITDSTIELDRVRVELTDNDLLLDYETAYPYAPFRALQVLTATILTGGAPHPGGRVIRHIWDAAREILSEHLDDDALHALATDYLEGLLGVDPADFRDDLDIHDLSAALSTAFRADAMHTMRTRGVV